MFITETSMRASTPDDVAALAAWAEDAGLDSGWIPHLPWSLDSLTAAVVAGRVTSRLELATAVTPTYPFHPMSMARSALSVDAVVGGRFTLGVGPSHPSVIETMHGMSYERPAAHTRDYLEVLVQAFDGAASAGVGTVGADGSPGFGELAIDGDFYSFRSIFAVPRPAELATGRRPGLVLAALAPLMLRLAGELADGTVTWFADTRTHASHIVPRITSAADAAGRPAPRVVAAMPIAVCTDESAGRAQAARTFATYEHIPTYKRVLDRGDGSGPADVVLTGPEEGITSTLAEWRDAGVTDFVAAPFPVGSDPTERRASIERTRDYLCGLVGQL